MMIHFWENTFWPKTSLSFVFRVPNSVYPEVFRCDDHNGTSFKAVWWSISEKKTHFGIKHTLFFVFRGPNSVHSEVFRCHSGTSFKAVWWSLRKTHFGNISLFIVFSVPKLRFSGLMMTVVQVSKLYNEFLKKNTFWAKMSLFFVFSGPNSVHSEVFSHVNCNGTSF